MGSQRVRHDWAASTLASLVTETVKHLFYFAMRETRVRFLGWEDPLEKGNGNPRQYSCLENSTDRGAWWATVHEVAKSQTRLSNFTSGSFSTVLQKLTQRCKATIPQFFKKGTSNQHLDCRWSLREQEGLGKTEVSGSCNWVERCYWLKQERFKKEVIWGRKMNNGSLSRC